MASVFVNTGQQQINTGQFSHVSEAFFILRVQLNTAITYRHLEYVLVCMLQHTIEGYMKSNHILSRLG